MVTLAPRLHAVRRAGRNAAHLADPPAGEDPTQRIADSITTAIVERRLMPGTKLAEQKIADVFKVSRTLVRQALMRLSRDHLITLEPARGARVAEPSVEEARQVFEARNMLEAAVVRLACVTFGDAQIAALRAHLRAEAEASKRSSNHTSGRTSKRTEGPGRTRLLADFHVVMAQMLGNAVMTRMLGDLVSRCSLIALMYPSAYSAEHSAEHSAGEHVAIVDALARKDARAAVRLVGTHLHRVGRTLQPDPRVHDLGSALLPRRRRQAT